MSSRALVLARLGIAAAFLLAGVLAGGAIRNFPTLPPVVFASDTITLEGLVAKIDGNTLYLVLNYGPLQAIDLSTMDPTSRGMLQVGMWATITATRNGDLIQGLSVEFSGECLEGQKNGNGNVSSGACHPGTIHGTADASEVIAAALGQPLSPLPAPAATAAPAAPAPTSTPTSNNNNSNGNNNGNGNGNDNNS